MSHTSEPSIIALRHLARLSGIQTGYVDMAGRRQPASTESMLAVLRTLGVPMEGAGDVPEALNVMRLTRAKRVLDPVQVAWIGTRTAVPVQLPAPDSAGALRCEWRMEDGETRRTETRLERLKVKAFGRVDGVRFVTRLLPIPGRLPAGYHRVTVECAGNQFETEVFSAPERCFQGPASRREWGAFAPLHALHSERSWGAGDFTDLSDFITWLGGQGGGFVGTLPLLPAFLEKPCEPSPYSPVSRLFWNEFYLDVTAVPELASCPAARRLMESLSFGKRIRSLNQASLVDYAAQMALKREVLEVLSRSFFARSGPRRQVFDDFLREHPEVADYSRFRAMHEEQGGSWTQWPVRMRRGDVRDGDCRAARLRYHLYTQWLAHEQMAALSRHARAQDVDLYLDMPLGTHRDGYDAWRHQKLFALAASGGAPPDPVFTQGQDWGFAPIHPGRSQEQGHAYIRSYLRHHLRHARMLRFDHVMGLHRLYWVPVGVPASQGAYVSYPAPEFYAMLSIESHRHQAVIIGENLGTVPAEVDRSLRRHGVSGMFVVQYEARPKANAALPRIPSSVIASLNTHDMPTFAAFWQGIDIDDRHHLGLIKRGDLAKERLDRDRIRTALVRYLRRCGGLKRGAVGPGAVLEALQNHLAASPARWVVINLEDLWLETLPQNTPGTSSERINWRRRTRISLEAIRAARDLADSLRVLVRLRRARPASLH